MRPPLSLYLAFRRGEDTDTPCGAVFAASPDDAAAKFAKPGQMIVRPTKGAPMQDVTTAPARPFRELHAY
jgi:hypothetical protein